MGLPLLLSLLLTPASAAPLSQHADLTPVLRAGLLKAAGELDGLDRNKEWLAKLPLTLGALGAQTVAVYTPPGKDRPLGEVTMDETRIRLTLKSLEATGFEPERALPALIWSILPTVMHETQHAIQIHELAKRGGIEAHFVEMEVDGKTIGTVTYLQILDKHPEAARLFLHGKSDNNEELAVWKQGMEAFSKETYDLYRAKDPLIPTVETGEAWFKNAAATLEASLEEIENDLKTANPEDRETLNRMKEGLKEQLATYRDRRVVDATVGYMAERRAEDARLWARWAKTDPKTRLETEAGLAPKERAELHLRVARQLATLSPTLHADEIEENLGRARKEAVAARDGRMIQRVGREQAGLQGRRLDYALDIVRGRAAVTDDPELRRKILEKQDEHLRGRLWPQHYRVFKEEVRANGGR